MEPSVDQHPSDPRRSTATVKRQDRIPYAVTKSEVAKVSVESDSPIENQQHDGENKEEKYHEDAVVSNTDIVSNPGTVVIEFLFTT